MINPRSRHGAECFELADQALQERGYQVLNNEQDLERGEFPDLIRRFAGQIDLVVAGGGDGTVCGILESLVEYDLLLHILPLGTANNLARTLGLPSELKANLESITSSRERRIDLGMVNRIYFVNVAGIGISTRVNREVSSTTKRWFGVFAFIWTALRMIRRARPFHVVLSADGQDLRLRCWQVTICNGRHYGSGLVASREASLDDGLLDCITTEVRSWWHALPLLPLFVHGEFDRTEDIRLVRASRITLRTHKPKVIDVDGDIKTKTPAEFSVVEKKLRVLVPPEVVVAAGSP